MAENQQVNAGNEEELAKVRALMEKAQQVNLGENLQHGVPIDYESTFGNAYKGFIEFKRPSMQDYMKMGALKAQFLGANGMVNINLVDNTIKFMAQVMSTLKVVIVKAPHWLLSEKGQIDVESIKEPDVLYHIFDKYEEWENSFRKQPERQPEGDSQASE